MEHNLSAKYEELIKRGNYNEAIKLCDAQAPVDKESPSNLMINLTIATQLIKTEAIKVLQQSEGAEAGTIEEINESIKIEIRKMINMIVGATVAQKEAPKFAEKKLSFLVEAKAVLDMIEHGEWSIDQWKIESFFQLLDIESEIDDEIELSASSSGPVIDSGDEENSSKDHEESGERIALSLV